MTRRISSGNQNDSLMGMFVLDVLRYDVETVSSIINLLNNRGSIGWRSYWAHDFTEEEVVSALENLVPKGLVECLSYGETLKELVAVEGPEKIGNNVDSLWFALTTSGYRVWEQWTPPSESEKQQPIE